MEKIIAMCIQNNYVIAIIGIVLGFAIKWFFATDIVKGFCNRIQDNSKLKQQHKIDVQKNMQVKYFSLTEGIVQQNKTLQDFIKQGVMKQFQNIRSRDDWTQRYIDQISQGIKQSIDLNHKILQRMGKPFLSIQVAKWLFQIIMELHIRRKLDYLMVVREQYDIAVDKQIVIADIYRTFRQITRQQMQFMNNFQTHYGQYGKVLKDIIHPQNFNKFIRQQIIPTMNKQKSQMSKQAQMIMLNYKDQLMKQIQEK